MDPEGAPLPDEADAAASAVMELVGVVLSAKNSPLHRARVRDVLGPEVTMADRRAIMLLHDVPPMTTGDAADLLHVDISRASRQLSRLAELGLITRDSDPADGRRSVISLHPSAVRAVADWNRIWVNDYLAPIADWDSQTVGRLGTFLERLRHELVEPFLGSTTARMPTRWGERAGIDETDERFERFGNAMLSFASWVTNSDQFEWILQTANSPVGASSIGTLRVIARRGPLAISDLAEQLVVDPSWASKRIKELDGHGLIDRAVDELDRRSSRARVSRKGAALLRRIDAIEREGILQGLVLWNADDLSRFAEILGTYNAALRSGVLDAEGWSVSRLHPVA